jgi:hypothetical protein
MHGRFFYTLPFHFDYPQDFYVDFNTVQSNNPDILQTNPRIWYKIKSIEIQSISVQNDLI